MNEKNTNNRNSLIIIVLAVLFCAYFLFGSGDNGSGTGEIRNELDAVGRNQQSIADGIADVEGTADSIAGSIDQSETAISGAAGTVAKLESNNKSAGELITECQQIIKRVRSRNEGKTAQP